jgi:hypothetical protein
MKHYYIGLMLASSANTDSGLAVADRNNEIILLDKLYTMNDIQHFFENFSSLKESEICISLPTDNTLLDGKWRLMSKFYQTVGLNQNLLNTNNWTQRFSTRGCDFFKKLSEEGVSITRFDLFLTRQALNLNSCFKERSPADCKTLQAALKSQFGFSALPNNMMPMAQLEALVGSILAKSVSENKLKNDKIFTFKGLDVIRN